MNRRLMILGLLAVAVLGAAALLAAATVPRGTADTVGAFDRRVRAYLMAHPEVIMDAVAVLERREQARRGAGRREALARNRDRLHAPGPLPVAGNPQGDVTVVEFFDYRCPYCKEAAAEVAKLLETDSGVRLVHKEFPVLGPPSVLGARAAIAAARQGKYLEFHKALMAHKGTLDEAAVMDLARGVGLDTVRLSADMARPEVDAVIRENHAVARDLGISGTPAFVIGETVMPGLVDAPTLARAVRAARARANRR